MDWLGCYSRGRQGHWGQAGLLGLGRAGPLRQGRAGPLRQGRAGPLGPKNMYNFPVSKSGTITLVSFDLYKIRRIQATLLLNTHICIQKSMNHN